MKKRGTRDEGRGTRDEGRGTRKGNGGRIAVAIALLLVMGMVLSGCAGLQLLAGRGAEAADTALGVAEWELCQAATVGAVRRKYGADPAKIEAWQSLCSEAGGPIGPVAPVVPAPYYLDPDFIGPVLPAQPLPRN